MAKKYLTSIDLNKNELLNAAVQKLATPPSNPVEGQIYYNTAEKKMYQYNGTDWIVVGDKYILPTASASTKGGVKVGNGLTITDEVVSVTTPYTVAEQEKLQGIEAGAEVNVIEEVKVNGEAQTITGKSIDITVPTTAAEVNALPDSTKYGYSLDMSYTASTGVVSVSLKDQDGNVLSTKTADLPLELLIESGSYNPSTKNIELVLANGNKILVPAGDLVDEYTADGTTITLTGNQFSLNSTLKANYDAAYKEKHTHSNKAVLDGITANNVADWNSKTNSYSTTIGDGSATSFTITHNLGTRNVAVAIYETASPYEEVIADVYRTTVNTVTINTATAPTSGQYTVVIIG